MTLEMCLIGVLLYKPIQLRSFCFNQFGCQTKQLLPQDHLISQSHRQARTDETERLVVRRSVKFIRQRGDSRDGKIG